MRRESTQNSHSGLWGWLVVPFFVLVWQVFSMILNKPAIFPSILDVVNAFEYFLTNQNENFFADILASLRRVLGGYLIGALLGLIIGVFTARIQLLSHTLGRLLQLLRSMTPVALVSLAVVWFGIGETSKYFLIAWGVFFTVWISTQIGVQNVEPRYIWAAQSLGVSKARMVYDVFLMAALPVIISGLRTAIAISFILVFVAELAGASEGIGYRLAISYQTGRPDRVIAALITLGALGAFADGLFNWASKKVFPWFSVASPTN